MKKRLFARIVAAVLCLCVVCALCACGAEKVDGGQYGDLTWEYYSDGRLVFSGNAEIPGISYNYDVEPPEVIYPEWYSYRAEIKNIEIAPQVTRIGMDAFVDFTALEKITVQGMSTEPDMDCIRYESAAEVFSSIIISAPQGSLAEEYAYHAGLEFEAV